MKALSWINVLLGLWLLVTGVAFSAASGPAMAGQSVTAVLIVVLAYASAVERPHPMISWGVAFAGLWGILLDAAVRSDPRSHAALAGFIVAILGAVNAVYRHRRVRSPM